MTIKQTIWDRMRKRMGTVAVDDQKELLETQWSWAEQLGFVDEDEDE